MRVLWKLAFAIVALSSAAFAESDDETGYRGAVTTLPWLTTGIGHIGPIAEVRLENGMRFLEANGTSEFLKLTGNPPSPNEYTLAPWPPRWFAIFFYESTGHIKDDEKLDADQLLSTLQEGNVKGNEERRRLGYPALTLAGWSVAPHYDAETRQLEWGTRLLDGENQETINYTVRILARTGVMKAILVTDSTTFEQDMKEFRAALRSFDFVPGERYAEFRQGDKVAEYGLAALVVGGAAAAAAKTGLLAKFGKFIFLAALAALAAISRFFKRLFRRGV